MLEMPYFIGLSHQPMSSVIIKSMLGFSPRKSLVTNAVTITNNLKI